MASALADFSETVEMVFHHVTYLLTVSAGADDTLCVEVEQKDDGSRWRGDFTMRYVEDITAKTGNYKKYAVFVKMLLTAITEESDSVFVDLLTYSDLELLKTRKLRGAGAAPPPRATGNNKRYLILTYAAEFDRVHYPLPLLFEEVPDADALQRTIRRLREELDATKGMGYGSVLKDGPDPSDLRRLREENMDLKEELQRLSRGSKDPGFERLMGEKKNLEREMRLCRKEREVLASRCDQREKELDALHAGHKRALHKKQREIDAMAEELARAKDIQRELRVKVRDLTSEMDRVSKRTGRAPYREAMASERRAYGSSRPTSRPTSRTASRATSNTHTPAGSRGSSRGQSPATSRPQSARRSPSPAGRFDPTAYVREREERIAARRGSSTHTSGRSTPTRPSSGRASPRVPPPPVPANVPRSRPSSRPASGAAPRAPSARPPAAEVAVSPASSPGKALEQVKAKLAELAVKEPARVAPVAVAKPSPVKAPRSPAKEAAGYDDASAEIADIDSRLHALQNFLKSAKASRP